MSRRSVARPMWALMAALPLVVTSVGLTAASAQAASGVGAAAGSSPAPTIRAAAPKPGAKCPKKNKTVTTKKYGKLKCTKVGKNSIWKKVATPKPVTTPVTPPTTPTPTPPALSCAAGGTCVVGDTGPGGGKIFMAVPTPGFRYLEAAPADVGPGALCNLSEAEWVARGLTGLSGSTGEGASNTTILANACSTGLADEVVAYRGGGKDDWFVPDSNELWSLVDENSRSNLGIFPAGSTQKYWTSTNVASQGLHYTKAWTMIPSDSNYTYYPWTTSSNPEIKVRPIRKVV